MSGLDSSNLRIETKAPKTTIEHAIVLKSKFYQALMKALHFLIAKNSIHHFYT
jgi:hypothetical protein